MERRSALLLAALASSVLAGCSTVTSTASVMNSEGVGGAFWYVRDSSKVFYCPPQVQAGSHQCTRAKILDEVVDVPVVLPAPVQAPPAAPAWQPPVVMPAPDPGAPSGGCRSDADCKGGRACRGGACM